MFFYVLIAAVTGLVYFLRKYLDRGDQDGIGHFPGPILCAVSNIPSSFHIFWGDHPRWIESLHAKYGPIVRTAPTELSFTTPSSWRDIYAFRKDHFLFRKSYSSAATAFKGSIVGEQDPAEHAGMRNMLAPAFSDHALRLQWPLITDAVNRFISELGKRGKRGEPIDLGKYLTCASFDIATSLAFGKDLRSAETGDIHPWVVSLKNGARAMGDKVCLEMVKERQNHPVDRPDVLGLILETNKKEGNAFSVPTLAARLCDVVIAGTETTAIALSTANYFAARDPAVLKKLRAEIRGRFSKISEITAATTADLPYVSAVVDEAMRIMSPVPGPLTRVVPHGGDTVDGYWLPAGTRVSTHSFAAPRLSANFKNPTEFHPERWIDRDEDKLEASQPFSLGPRACIGKSLALTEARMIMAQLHFQYEIELVDKNLNWVGQSKFGVVWSKPELWVHLRERKDL